MKYYITIVKFTDNETITLSFDSIEEMNEWYEAMNAYIEKIVVKIQVTVDENGTTAVEQF